MCKSIVKFSDILNNFHTVIWHICIAKHICSMNLFHIKVRSILVVRIDGVSYNHQYFSMEFWSRHGVHRLGEMMHT